MVGPSAGIHLLDRVSVLCTVPSFNFFPCWAWHINYEAHINIIVAVDSGVKMVTEDGFLHLKVL